MWLYNNIEFLEIPENSIGFVYRITNTITGRQYIGKKLFTAGRSRQIKGRRRRFRVESDWRTYYGSNKQLQCDVIAHGRDAFLREILHLCATKGQCSYFEAKLQFQYGVLEQPDIFYNQFIGCKIHLKHLKL